MVAEKDWQSPLPNNTNGHLQSNEAGADAGGEEKRRQKWKKYMIYGCIFVVVQVIVILVFVLVIMKVTTPKYRLRSASFDTFSVVNKSPNNASFNLKMNAELGVKNPNWGSYKYGNTAIMFYYKDTLVGTAVVPKSKAGFKSTKKIKNVAVDLVSPTSLGRNSQLRRDLDSGIVSLRSESKLDGKIAVMMMFKKRRISNLNCTMDVDINTKQLKNVKCTT